MMLRTITNWILHPIRQYRSLMEHLEELQAQRDAERERKFDRMEELIRLAEKTADELEATLYTDDDAEGR